MSKLLSYKNYSGTVEYSTDDECLFGKVIGIKSLISYEGSSVDKLKKDFENAIDEYLEDCNKKGVIAEVPIDPFYSKGNIEYLEKTINNIKTRKTKLIEHKLIED